MQSVLAISFGQNFVILHEKPSKSTKIYPNNLVKVTEKCIFSVVLLANFACMATISAKVSRGIQKEFNLLLKNKNISIC